MAAPQPTATAPPPVPTIPDFLFPLLLVTAALLVALVLWRLRVGAAGRAARRRAAGYQLIGCLKSYAAWIDYYSDEPLMHGQPEALSVPPPLAQAVRIQELNFPELSTLVAELVQTHRELMQYLREQDRLHQTGAAVPDSHHADRRYQQLRDLQDAALDSLFTHCRQLIGDDDSEWNRTGSDFSFSGDVRLPPRRSGAP